MNLLRKKSEKSFKSVGKGNEDNVASQSINVLTENQSNEQELSEQVEDSEVEYKVGNYQLRVHIIECAELIANSGTGFVDPIVFIEILGQKVYTKQKKKCSACIFDESFYIQLPDMNESKIQDGNLSIDILDCSSRISSLLSNNIIGTFSIDLETIYEHSGHEIYRQWVPLISPNKPEITGKLLLTTSLLGPGDKAIVHDRKAELIEEKKERLKAAGSSSLCPVLFSAPPFAQKLSFLVVEIYKAEGIPVLDSAIIAGKMYNYISASVGVEFDQHDRVRTGTAHLIRKHMNNAEYMTALWLPYMDPSFSSRIQLRLLEHHTMSDATVLSSTLCPAMHLRSVRQGMEGKAAAALTAVDPTQLFWVNLYGAPVPEVVQGRDTQKSAMNLYPDTASAYRGRLLVRLRIDDNKPNAKGQRRNPEVLRYAMDREYFNMVQGKNIGESPQSPWGGGLLGLNTKSPSSNSDRSMSVATDKELDKDKGGRPSIVVTSAPPLPSLHNNGTSADSTEVRASMNTLGSPNKPTITDIYGLPMPSTSRYVLKAMVFAGQSFPQRTGLSSTRFSVELRLMHRRLITPELHMKNGFIMWEQPVLLKDTFDLPANPSMMPDLFLYILNKELTPLCFKRFSLLEFLKLPEEKQFQRPADWEILQLDDTFSFPSPDTFPGSVLLKIGFGKQEVSEHHTWNTTINTKRTLCQVNIHVYQGRGLPPSDRSGLLDPYVVVRVGTQKLKSKIHKQTRDPQFFETLSFFMELPLDDDLKPQLFLELYDQDTIGDDFVGLIKLDLALAAKRSVFNKSTEQLLAAQLKDPEWYGLRSRKGADLMGQLLVGFEVLNLDRVEQTSGSSLLSTGRRTLPSPSLVPTRSTWVVDMHVLGLRDLVPPGLLPVYKPYVSIRLNNAQLCKLPPSRRPTPTDPNYLCRFEETVQLPENILFSPSIAVTVKDKKTSALSATILGTASIPLDYKMLSALGKPGQAQRLQRHRPQFRSGNPFSSQEELIDEQITLHDSSSTREDDQVRWDDKKETEKAAAGIRAELLKNAAAVRIQRPSDDLPEYLHGRLQLETELETGLLEAPFERYPLTTGSVATGIDDLFDNPFSQVGVLKCNVTLRPELAVDSSALVSRHITEEPLKIRLYVLRGSNLAGHDADNLSDPYLVVTLGSRTVSTRDRHKRNTRDPRFYECFEFTSKLPGVNDILISVKDHNDIYHDELIGSTVIDLEDRWYCLEYQNLCRLTAENATSASEPRAPLEVRSLWSPKSNAAQGTLSMWMDILTLEEARRYPMKDIAPPPQEEWEVRVIVWSASDVPSGDEFEDMNDLFIKCHLGGNSTTEQSTDTHLRLPAGQKGSFNWRMKFPIKLPVSENCEGGTRLTVEAWDLDFLTSSQGLGACQIDLADSLDTALRKRNRKLKAGKSTRFVHQHFYRPSSSNTSTRPTRAAVDSGPKSYLGLCTSICSSTVSCVYRWLCCRCSSCFGLASSATTGRSEMISQGSSSNTRPTLAVDVDLELGESTPLLSPSDLNTGRKYEYSTAASLETIDPRLSPSDCTGGRKYRTLSPALSSTTEVRHQLSPIPETWDSCRLEYPSQSPSSPAGWSTYPIDNAHGGEGEDRLTEPLSPSDSNGGRKYVPPGLQDGKTASKRLSPSGDNGGRKYITVLTSPPVAGDQEETELDEQGDLEDPIAPGQDNSTVSGNINPKEKPRKRRKKRLSMYESTLQAMGFGVAVIEHAAEVPLTAADGSPAGKVLMSIEILHKSVADTLPTGLGRSEPNAHPHLPEPEGRIDFTKMWNPFYMLRVCVGEKIFAEFACMFSCILCLLVYYFVGQPILTLIMAMKEFFGVHVVLVLLCALLVAACAFGTYVRNKCRKVCCHSEDDEEQREG